jgi:hypothetical protein
MSNRIITNGDGKPPLPQTMQELLDQAHNDIKFKRRDEAMFKILNAVSMVSVGTAQCMKSVNGLVEYVQTNLPEKPSEPNKES